MASRRMFSKDVVVSDYFLNLSHQAQCLYFHLGMQADDDGFVNNPMTVTRMIGVTRTELNELIKANLLISFESGVIVITHWRMHNYVRNDRYKPTIYKEEKDMIKAEDNVYQLK